MISIYAQKKKKKTQNTASALMADRFQIVPSRWQLECEGATMCAGHLCIHSDRKTINFTVKVQKKEFTTGDVGHMAVTSTCAHMARTRWGSEEESLNVTTLPNVPFSFISLLKGEFAEFFFF